MVSDNLIFSLVSAGFDEHLLSCASTFAELWNSSHSLLIRFEPALSRQGGGPGPPALGRCGLIVGLLAGFTEP